MHVTNQERRCEEGGGGVGGGADTGEKRGERERERHTERERQRQGGCGVTLKDDSGKINTIGVVE